MAHHIVYHDGAETGDTVRPKGVGATAPTLESTITAFSKYAYRWDQTGGAANCYIIPPTNGFNSNGSNNTTAKHYFWATFHLYVENLPPTASDYIYLNLLQQSGGGNKGEIRIRSDGKVEIDNGSGAWSTVSAGALEVGKWYTCSIGARDNTANGYSFKARLKSTGSTVVDVKMQAANWTTIYNFYFGSSSTSKGDWIIDNIIFESADTDAEVEDPYLIYGDAYTEELLVSDGTGSEDHANWSNDYIYLDEVPHDSNTTERINTTGAATFLETMQGVPSLTKGIDSIKLITAIQVMRGWAGGVDGRLRLKSGATISETTSRNFNGLADEPNHKMFEVDPDTSAAWTTSGLNRIELGVNKISATYGLAITASYLAVLYKIQPAVGNQIIWIM